MARQKSPDPNDRMGAFKRLSEVPDTDILAEYTRRYDGVDVWAANRDAQTNAFESTHYEQTFEKTERTWKSHMTDRDRHHALAIPEEVETWCRTLAETPTYMTVYKQYWVRLEEFYSWLQWHTDHPHAYHPVLMAAAQYDTAGTVWETKVGC